MGCRSFSLLSVRFIIARVVVLKSRFWRLQRGGFRDFHRFIRYRTGWAKLFNRNNYDSGYCSSYLLSKNVMVRRNDMTKLIPKYLFLPQSWRSGWSLKMGKTSGVFESLSYRWLLLWLRGRFCFSKRASKNGLLWVVNWYWPNMPNDLSEEGYLKFSMGSAGSLCCTEWPFRCGYRPARRQINLTVMMWIQGEF